MCEKCATKYIAACKNIPIYNPELSYEVWSTYYIACVHKAAAEIVKEIIRHHEATPCACGTHMCEFRMMHGLTSVYTTCPEQPLRVFEYRIDPEWINIVPEKFLSKI